MAGLQKTRVVEGDKKSYDSWKQFPRRVQARKFYLDKPRYNSSLCIGGSSFETEVTLPLSIASQNYPWSSKVRYGNTPAPFPESWSF
jgi:hypothetical protein